MGGAGSTSTLMESWVITTLENEMSSRAKSLPPLTLLLFTMAISAVVKFPEFQLRANFFHSHKLMPPLMLAPKAFPFIINLKSAGLETLNDAIHNEKA